MLTTFLLSEFEPRRRSAVLVGGRPSPGTGEGALPAPPDEDAEIPPTGRDGGSFVPGPARRAIKARTADSHLISSSSLGAQSSKVRFGVMILKVKALPGAAGSVSAVTEPDGGKGDDG